MSEGHVAAVREANAHLLEFRYAAARDAYYRALQLGPANADMLLTLGGCCAECGQIEEAVVYTRASLALNPNEPRAHVQLGILCLMLGHANPGWTELAHRRHLRPSPMAPQPPIPEWDGRALDGRGIVLLPEQGLGDAIQCLRYVARLQALGGTVYLDTNPLLARLFKAQFAPGTVLEPGQSARISTFAYMMDLPHAFGDDPHGVSAGAYIRAPEDAVPRLPPLPAGRLRIGLAWSGNAVHPRDRMRSIDLELLKPLMAHGHHEFVSLLPANRTPDIVRAGLEHRVLDVSAQMKDLYDVAGFIDQLDLVITVDTAVAHLAGAMGKRVWMLVTNPPDWRWGLKDDHTSWYPTMRLFRQEVAGAWAPVIARVVEALRQNSHELASH